MPGTPPDVSRTVSAYLADTRAALDALSPDEIQTLVAELQRAYAEGRQVFIIGNGGSAATASHFACDLAKTILGRPIDRRAKLFRVISLVDNMALITAWANDFSFDDVFAEQLRLLGQPGDVLVAITGSGNSPNVLAAVDVAKQLGIRTVGLLGFDGGLVKDRLDTCVVVHSDHYGHIEDMHMMLVHLTTAYFSAFVHSGAEL
jgi:D-sedoheptulose 7-phosphate isomerase